MSINRCLVILSSSRMPDNRAVYEAFSEYVAVDVIRLSSDEQKNLKKSLKEVNYKNYDVVIFDLFFKRIYKQYRYINKIPNLFIYEEDACQNFIETSRWHGKFLQFYRRVPRARVLCTGVGLAARLCRLGVGAHFFPKGFDETIVWDEGVERDIPYGFVGRLSSDTYRERREFLVDLQKSIPLQILRSEPGEAYRNTLNRINFFVSADIGLGEYMIKNFEAMAAGCVLCAFGQGEEEVGLGLVDMENIVLYSDQDELLGKLKALTENEELSRSIATCGREYAKNNFSLKVLGKKLFQIVEKNTSLVG